MIKLIHVFDKVKIQQAYRKSDYSVEDSILESLSSLNMDDLSCPICSGKETIWVYRYTRPHSFIWENPENPVSIPVPTYQYRCTQCRGHGTETITTDVTIGKTGLSYHYLFKLLRADLDLEPSDRNICELYNLLYGKRSEETLKRWKARFQADFVTLSLLVQITQEDFLFERVEFGTIFRKFYISQKRFFMDDSRIRMVIDNHRGEKNPI